MLQEPQLCVIDLRGVLVTRGLKHCVWGSCWALGLFYCWSFSIRNARFVYLALTSPSTVLGWAVGPFRRVSAQSLLWWDAFPYALRNASPWNQYQISISRTACWKPICHHSGPLGKPSARQRGLNVSVGDEAGTALPPTFLLLAIHCVNAYLYAMYKMAYSFAHNKRE